MLLEIFLLIITLLIVALIASNNKPKGLPPGEWGWPIIGNVAKVEDLTENLINLSKKHGNICYVKFGSRILIVLSEFSIIKKAFAKQEFTGRPDFFTFQIFNNFLNIGLVSSEEQEWNENRRFALRHLRDFGLGRSSMEGIILREVEELIKDLAKKEGRPCGLEFNLNVAIVNVTWKLVADRRYETTDEVIIRFTKMIDADLETVGGPVALLDFFPALINIVPKFIQNSWMKVSEIEYNRDTFNTFLKVIIDDHLSSMDPNNPRDYIDSYLIEMESRKNDPNSSYSCRNLMACVSDLFVAGSETTSSTLRWIILYFAMYPEVQKKVQQQIDENIPHERLPGLDDKEKLPYLEAVLHEIQRLVSLAPNGLFHRALEDTQFEGYSIPQGALLVPLLQHCHKSPTHWSHPLEFYPEHFLDENGQFVAPKEGFLPFSIGRRACLGESVARMELFLFTSGLLQQFSIDPPEGIKLTTERDSKNFIINKCLPYEVVFTRRRT